LLARCADFTFVDARFLRRTLADFGACQGYVLYFTTCDCPLARRYLPRLKELERSFGPRGWQFVAVNVGLGDTVVDAQAQALDHDVASPFVRDPGLEVARATGARCAGEAIVLDAQRRIRYRGRVDDQYRLGGERESPGREDLKEALQDLA